MAKTTPNLLTDLRERVLARCGTEEELRTLCADLGVNYDDLPAQGRAHKARELVACLERLSRVPDLQALLARPRPRIIQAIEDYLAGLFTSQKLPGVGASLGLDRLLAAMEELKLLGTQATPAPVLITQFDAARLGDYLRIGRVLRAVGINAEVYPDAKKLGKQLQYADRKGFRIALIAGSDEFAKGVWQVKNLASGEATSVEELGLVDTLLGMLSVK